MLNKLGKQLFIILIALPLSASVEVIAPEYFMEGEALDFQIVAKGFNIQIPEIKSIDGHTVENIKSSEEAVLIGILKANKKTNTYRLFAKKSITIPSFNIDIDHAQEYTKSKTVKLKKISKTISKDFDLDMKLNKKYAYIGEEVILTLKFTYNELEDYILPEVNFPNILLKEINNKEYKTEEGYLVEEITYSLVPQINGKIDLRPLKVEVESLKKGYKNLNNRSKYIKKTSIYSNELTLNVKTLPKGISIFGNYKLNTSIDKQSVYAGEAVTLILTIEGKGNIDNMDALTLDIPDATIYAKSKDKSRMFEIISDKNFTIPSIIIDYYDKNRHKKKTLKSKSFKIEVIDNNSIVENSQELHENENYKEIKTKEFIYFFIGSLSSILIIIIFKLFNKIIRRKKQIPLIKVLKQSKNKDDLLKKIVPYFGQDKSLDRLIYQLEGDNMKKFKKIKKEIIEKTKIVLTDYNVIV